MKNAFLLALTLTLICGCATRPSNLRPVDDSYTISQRFANYDGKYAGLRLPVSEFISGQKILFDRSYKRTENRELHIDIFLPPVELTNRQAILLVHGGAWRSGSKSHFYALANLMAQRGYTVFIPEYRLSPESVYPAGLTDVNDAIVWAKTHAAEFNIDENKFAIGGASSGGQMAALLAYTADLNLFKERTENTRANAMIDLDGVLDFTIPLALANENAAGPNSVAAKWLGGSWEQVPQKWREASAAKYVNANSPPTLIISSGLMRFTAGKDEVISSLNQFGIANEYFEFSGAPHDIWLFEPYLGQIVNQIDSFLKSKAR